MFGAIFSIFGSGNDGRYAPATAYAPPGAPAATIEKPLDLQTPMSRGERYADLDNAFAYRDKVSNGCSCNGKDGLGLARVETSSDPTLRPGDIVATDDGLTTYTGSTKTRTSEFTPISSSSSEWARRLSEVKVRPAPPSEKIEPVANDETKSARKGRAQASREQASR